ncbi:RND family efflux transporter MFP subunit [Corallococcus coralloides]|uniref:RND family efflux transporter MFP subunit n=1 Tax=Corallococcus coralloides TaxID=184914 RepID=A0A410RJ69_CORCK|nr:RND family efflux transporter MFP subunit [Corallococcus coralloides]
MAWGVDIPKPRAPRRKPYLLAALGLAALVAVTVGLSRLRPAAPTVDKASVWLDTVKRGPLVRQVKGTGSLVPESIRWLTADTAGRVERIHVRPGATVTAGTLLLELSNPDVQLQALEAERQLASAEGDFLELRELLQTQRLSQQATVATLTAESAAATRRARLRLPLDAPRA